jgi:hypothetical protein
MVSDFSVSFYQLSLPSQEFKLDSLIFQQDEQTEKIRKISGSYGGDYEDDSLQYCAVWSRR